ncbi:hypothetical protein IV417_15525 [Alphaproteobacteria bacterium KMM 3653]|uniref:CENP-V/GFA domain-containing protein n=1 Tax=Harenicola maris TaxID=2841044 RepID=A0AAP2G9V6_9RHOB|nr:hypothetical protein [Harenicola maris]
MSFDLKCRCGQVHLRLSPARAGIGSHALCYCKDCRAVAKHLGADHMIGPRGRIRVFQTRPDRVTLEAGGEHIACLQLREGGMHRWYAACCNTPLANSFAKPSLPFVALVLGEREDADCLGPVIGVGNAASALPGDGETPKDRGIRRLIWRFLRRTVSGRMVGAAARSPFLQGGAPIAEARVLSDAERRLARG